MMYLHLGKPRSGKTYDVIRSVVLPSLEKGRRVLTNIEGLECLECREWIAARCGVDVDSKLIWLDETAIRRHAWFSEPENGDVFIIDECQIFWPGGSLKPSDPDAFAFMTRHGHYNTDIHLITQSEKNVDSHMRRLCGQTQVYRKLGFVGLSGSYQVQYYNGSEPLQSCYINSTTKRYDPEIFKAYKSIVDGADVPTAKQANLFTSKKFILVYLIVVAGVVMGIRNCQKLRSGGLVGDVSEKAPAVVSERVSGAFFHQSSAAARRGFPLVSYTSAYRLDARLFALRLEDGSLKLLSTSPLPSGIFFSDSVFFAPLVQRAKDD